MKKKTYDRMKKLVSRINNSPLSVKVKIKKLSEQQDYYNPILREWTGGNKNWEIVAEVNCIFSSFKKSEEWRENGMLNIADYRASMDEGTPIDSNCIVETMDGRQFEVVFIRDYIGEVIVGLRPRVTPS